MTIAKLRAARQLWARVAEVVGTADAGAARIHAVTSLPMMTQRDPWVNMLRTTLAAFSAGVGGADTVQVHPFDAAIPGGLHGTSASFARRIARNTQLLLLEESHIGQVLDPAGGSWFVEDLTAQLAEQAWAHFQDIEARGGFVAARDYVAAQIAEVAARRSADIAHRRTAITGVNEFPNLDEKPLPQGGFGVRRSLGTRPGSRRCATARTRSWRRPVPVPRCLLLPLGPLAEHNIRTTFAVEPVGVRRNRGGQPGHRRRRRGCRGGGRGRRPDGGGAVRNRCPLRHRGVRRRWRPHARPVSAGAARRPGKGCRPKPIRSPTDI